MQGPSTTIAMPSRPHQARRALGWLVGFGAFGVGLSALYATTGRGVGCALRALTGWECPLCGGTRLGSALLHGDAAAAFAYNPVVFVALSLLTGLSVLWLVESLGGPRIRPPEPVAAQLRRVTPTQWLLLGCVVAVAYTVLRNLL